MQQSTRVEGSELQKKGQNKIKTKAKTVNRYVNTRQQKVAMAKARRTNQNTLRNRKLNEAIPAVTSDTEQVPEIIQVRLHPNFYSSD